MQGEYFWVLDWGVTTRHQLADARGGRVRDKWGWCRLCNAAVAAIIAWHLLQLLLSLVTHCAAQPHRRRPSMASSTSTISTDFEWLAGERAWMPFTQPRLTCGRKRRLRRAARTDRIVRHRRVRIRQSGPLIQSHLPPSQFGMDPSARHHQVQD